jgi:hypothetical protein
MKQKIEERVLKVVVIPYHALPCSCETFTINGERADKDDFGSTCDMDPDNAPEYGCGNRLFIPKMPTDEVLAKYFINLKEYAEICEKLKDMLAVGECGWCI